MSKTYLPFLAVSTGFLALAGCAVSAPSDPRNTWDTKPLGPNVPPLQWQPAPAKRTLKSNFKTHSVQGRELALAREGVPQATLVVPATDNASVQAAVAILQKYLEKISGAKFSIISEDKLPDTPAQVLVALGETELARKAGITASDLRPEGYRLQTQGNTLFIVGNDKGKGVASYGTRNGVYALLERHFGCRWIWPGELGEVVPRRSTLTLKPLHEQDEPALEVRNLRNYYPGGFYTGQPGKAHRQHRAALAQLQRSEEDFVAKAADSGTWFEAQGLGQSFNLQYRHAYGAYWEKYGKTHPEYFALQPDGSRSQAAAPKQARLDVSNDALIKTIANDLIKRFDKDPDLASLSISPNDGGPPGFCMCEVCRRLDPPNAPPITLNLGAGKRGASYVSLTDRYVTFYAKIAEQVQKKHPDRKLGAYAYSAYKTPPLYAKLPSNVIVGFVGLGYLNDESRQADLQDWDLWTRAADSLMLRPNAFYGGLDYPVLYPHRLADDIKHCYQTGMMGADFDSVMHNWGAQGLNYYVLAKLLWDPSQDVDKLIQDYTGAGFGKASPQVQVYFAALEKLTTDMAKSSVDWEEVAISVSSRTHYRQLRVLADTFNDANINRLQTLLDTAKTQAAGDATVLERIEFLEQPLRYARVQGPAARLFLDMLADKDAGADPAKRKQLIDALEKRRTVFQDIYDNHFYAQSLINSTYREWSNEMWQEFGWELPKVD